MREKHAAMVVVGKRPAVFRGSEKEGGRAQMCARAMGKNNGGAFRCGGTMGGTSKKLRLFGGIGISLGVGERGFRTARLKLLFFVGPQF